MKPMCNSKPITRFAFCESGNVVVEFGLVASLLMITALGTLEFAAVMSQTSKMSNAARAAVERAIHDPTDITGITNVAVRSGNLNSGTLNVTSTQFCECPGVGSVPCTDTCAGGSMNNAFITVNLSQPAESYMQESSFLDGITLVRSATVRLR
jgi:Flp pilus assembly protein TadG